MDTLVTGGTGFIGSHLVERLIQNNHNIKMLVRHTSNFSHLKNKNVEIVFGDLSDKKSIEGICRDVDVVFHLSGLVHKKGATYNDYWNANVTATKNLFDVCMGNNVKKIVHASTVHVLGLRKNRTETCDYSPDLTDPYEVTKIEGEKIALEYSNKLPITIVRPDFVYGPRDKNLLPLIRWVNKKIFCIVGNGNALVQPTYVTDVIDGLELVAKNKKSRGKIYNIAGPEMITMNKFIKIISDSLGVKRPRIRIPLSIAKSVVFAAELGERMIGKGFMLKRKLDFLTLDHTTDISKSQRELGYRPKISVEEGIRKTVRWYKENGYLN